jgi:2-methylisocitrate lyase-like PEP mutase family enzyme
MPVRRGQLAGGQRRAQRAEQGAEAAPRGARPRQVQRALTRLAQHLDARHHLPQAGQGEPQPGHGVAGQLAGTIRAVVAAGAVGVNIEDAGPAGGLCDVADQCARLAAARSAAGSLFLNARVDTMLCGLGGVADTVERATAYLAAGADGIFVPGVVAPDAIAELVERIPAPLNVMAGPGAPAVPELAKLGVARVSLGPSVAQAAYSVARRAAEEAFGAGTYRALDGGEDFGVLNGLFR